MESGILVLEIQNSTNDWNLQSKSHWQNDPESTECNPESNTGLDSTVIGGQSAANFFVWSKSLGSGRKVWYVCFQQSSHTVVSIKDGKEFLFIKSECTEKSSKIDKS